MKNDKCFEELMEEDWDTYHDLTKVHATQFCKKNNFNLNNTLVVDSFPSKVQRCLANSIVPEEYLEQDVFVQERLFKGETKVLDDAWQELHMLQLADFIISLLDRADNVPDFL